MSSGLVFALIIKVHLAPIVLYTWLVWTDTLRTALCGMVISHIILVLQMRIDVEKQNDLPQITK